MNSLTLNMRKLTTNTTATATAILENLIIIKKTAFQFWQLSPMKFEKCHDGFFHSFCYHNQWSITEPPTRSLFFQ